MKTWVVVLAGITFAANWLFMIFWFSVSRLRAVGPDAMPINNYDAISLQITILGIILTAVAIGIAIVSVFGYQALREAVLARADALVNQRLNKGPASSEGGEDSGGAAPSGEEIVPPDAETIELESNQL